MEEFGIWKNRKSYDKDAKYYIQNHSFSFFFVYLIIIFYLSIYLLIFFIIINIIIIAENTLQKIFKLLDLNYSSTFEGVFISNYNTLKIVFLDCISHELVSILILLFVFV